MNFGDPQNTGTDPSMGPHAKFQQQQQQQRNMGHEMNPYDQMNPYDTVGPASMHSSFDHSDPSAMMADHSNMMMDQNNMMLDHNNMMGGQQDHLMGQQDQQMMMNQMQQGGRQNSIPGMMGHNQMNHQGDPSLDPMGHLGPQGSILNQTQQSMLGQNQQPGAMNQQKMGMMGQQGLMGQDQAGIMGQQNQQMGGPNQRAPAMANRTPSTNGTRRQGLHRQGSMGQSNQYGDEVPNPQDPNSMNRHGASWGMSEPVNGVIGRRDSYGSSKST